MRVLCKTDPYEYEVSLRVFACSGLYSCGYDWLRINNVTCPSAITKSCVARWQKMLFRYFLPYEIVQNLGSNKIEAQRGSKKGDPNA